MPTADQRAADTAVREAIEQAVRAYGLIPPDATMVDFVIVIEGLRYRDNAEDEHDEFRALLYREGIARTSVALGLLDLGRVMIHDDIRAHPLEGSD